MTDNKEFDCDHTDEIVCPYCGESFTDSWEHDPDCDTATCGSCDKEFFVDTQIMGVKYSTKKKEDE